MGFFNFGGSNDLSSAQTRVNCCQANLDAAKASREEAKKGCNYKNASKCYRHGDKVGNIYDDKVWRAQDALKDAKALLAAAKKRK